MQNRVLRTIFGPRREEANILATGEGTQDWRKMYYEKL
jgi:hypothetical protein